MRRPIRSPLGVRAPRRCGFLWVSSDRGGRAVPALGPSPGRQRRTRYPHEDRSTQIATSGSSYIAAQMVSASPDARVSSICLVTFCSVAWSRLMRGMQGSRFTYSRFSRAADIFASLERKLLVFQVFALCQRRKCKPLFVVVVDISSALSTGTHPQRQPPVNLM